MDASMTERVEELAQQIALQARTQEDLLGLVRQMMKSALQQMLDTELDVHLGRRGNSGDLASEPPQPVADIAPAGGEPPPKAGRNRRNGHSQKTVKGDMGELRLEIPRDRDGTFEPRLIPKHQRRIPGFDEKILALYAKGMTTRDIQDVLRELYGVEVSPTLISEITADLDQQVTAWRTRPLDPVWPIVYFDGIVVHVRGGNGRVSQHAIYVAIGVNLDGHKELLGLWLSENEGAKFWLGVLTDMKNRGLADIIVACIDGLAGFADAIHAAYPETRVQLCVVHLVRAALRYVSDQDGKAVARDLKKIYNAETLLAAEVALDEFAQAWDGKYPTISKMWRAKWTDIITLFDFPWPIRKAIATTNTIESVNSVIRKLTRNRKIYPNEDSALKIIYMAIQEASKRWTMPIRNWKPALNHFAIMYGDRIPK
jgi:transposase-like protein